MLCVENGTSPTEHMQYNVSGPYVNMVRYFCLFRKKFTLIFVVKSLKGFGWNNVALALGQYIVLSGVSG